MWVANYVAEKAKGMSQKKSLEEQCKALLKGQADCARTVPKLDLNRQKRG
jgi:hypothetical protein